MSQRKTGVAILTSDWADISLSEIGRDLHDGEGVSSPRIYNKF